MFNEGKYSDAFEKYQVAYSSSQIISVKYLLDKLRFYTLKVDWIIGCSGAVVTDGIGNLLWTVPIDLNQFTKLDTHSQIEYIKMGKQILQITMPIKLLQNNLGLRVEVYQNIAFVTNCKASKLLHYMN